MSWRGQFLWRFRRNPSLWDDAVSVRPSVWCVCSLGIYFWEHLELRNLANVSLGTLPGGFFQKNFKNLKMGFLANFFTFFLKNGGVFLWTHVQSWNCGEIMRGCLMKCIFFGRFSKISKLDFWRIFLWKSRESLVSNLGKSRVDFNMRYIWLRENPLIPPPRLWLTGQKQRVYI